MATNTGLKNEDLLKELQRGGSAVVKPRNDFGVYLFDDADPKDGIVFSKLSKPKYIESELLKTIDTTISELLPVTASELPPTILLELYNEVTASLSSSLSENEKLKGDILSLSASLNELNTEMDELLIINDALNLNTAAAENTLQIVNGRLTLTVEDLQDSIQRATNESIARVNLQAENDVFRRNEAILESNIKSLQTQIDQLRTQLSTLIGIGLNEIESAADIRAEQIANDPNKGKFIASPVSRADFSKSPIYAEQRYRGTGKTKNDPIQFVNGQVIQIQNLSTLNELGITITKGGQSTEWLVLNNNNITIPPGGTYRYTINTDIDWVNSNQDKKEYFAFITIRSDTGFSQILNATIKRIKR
jgi:hypothetical protein